MLFYFFLQIQCQVKYEEDYDTCKPVASGASLRRRQLNQFKEKPVKSGF